MLVNFCNVTKKLNFFKTNTTLFISIILFYSCAGVKNLHNDKKLLLKNNFIENNNLIKNDIEAISAKKPNSFILGIPWKFNIYNLAETNPDSLFDNWLDKKINRRKKWERFFSKKQLVKIKQQRVNFNNWIKDIGEPPSIITNRDVEITRKRVEIYYKNRGYFDVEVDSNIDTIKNKTEVNYNIKTNKLYYLDSISYKIDSPELIPLYKENISKSYLAKGKPFNASDFQKERQRIVDLIKQNGGYGFQKSSIQFNLELDSIENRYKIPVQVNISPKQTVTGDTVIESPYNLYKINKVKLFIENPFQESNNTAFLDTLYKDLEIYYKENLAYKPKLLYNIPVRKGNVYTNELRNDIYQFFLNTRSFKSTNIIYEIDPKDDHGLITSVYLKSRERYSLNFDLDGIHSNIQTIGFYLGVSGMARNVFGGNETFEITARGNLGYSPNIESETQFFNLYEYGVDTKLFLPRIFFLDFNRSAGLSNKKKSTEFLLGTSFQKNVGLDRLYLNTAIQYNWQFTPSNTFSLKWLDFELISNRNASNYFNIYRNTYDRVNSIYQKYKDFNDYSKFSNDDDDNLRKPDGVNDFTQQVLLGRDNIVNVTDYNIIDNIEKRRQRVIANNIISAVSFSYFNKKKFNLLDNDFQQIRLELELAGNLLSLYSSLINKPKNARGYYEYFGIEHSQYIKTEFDFIKNLSIDLHQTLAFRFFLGLAFPFGNASTIPFTESYFAGGSNDNRAWQVYRLGPGTIKNYREFNEANFKLAFNAEYRYPIFKRIKGAMFVDVGNIWNFQNNDIDPASNFDGFQDLSELAIGSGLGIRFDFSFVLLRLDLGFKIYDPTLIPEKRFFTNTSFNNSVLNIGINYPF